MIVFNRWADVAPGKVGEAVTFATEISALIKKLTGVELIVMMPVGGHPNRIIWQATYENLAAMEAVNEVFMASEEYHAAVQGATHLFLPGSVRDAMGKTVG